LQIEHDNDTIGSVKKANQLELLQKDLVELHKKAVASVSAIQVSNLHQSIRKNRTDIKNMLEELKKIDMLNMRYCTEVPRRYKIYLGAL
jgi:hypothetical protein